MSANDSEYQVQNALSDFNQDELNAAKRKRDDENLTENQYEDATKKIKADEAAAASYAVPITTVAPIVSAAAGQELIVLEVAPEKVGQVIGSKGMVITDIQQRSGARAHVNQDFPDGVNRQINITGLPHQVKIAADLIKMIIEHGPTAIHVNSMVGGPTVTSIIDCSQPQVGKIIGTAGATIKELQSKSGAKIQIDQDFPPDQTRKINITGTAPAVALGVQLIQALMAGDTSVLGNSYGMPGMGAGAVGSMQLMGSESKQVMGVPKSAVGKIIGRGGEIISVMQKKSGARVTVDQSNESDCKAIITGTPQAISFAQSMIQEILNGVNPSLIGANLPMPGGGMGRGAMMSPYGMPMPQQQQYGMGGMGMYGMGGMPQQQQPQYGAYGAGYGESFIYNVW